MSKRKIFFRADANATIGMGHFYRTLALAEMLKDDFHCVFATKTPNNSQIREINKICHSHIRLPSDESHFIFFLSLLKGDEIVVLDNYYFTSEYQQIIKNKGCKLVCIDDLHDKYFVSDIVINHTPILASDYNIRAYTKLLLGFKYALLRKDFFKCKKKDLSNNFKNVFICFGGADFNNLTNKTLKIISQIEFIESITVLVGNAYNNFEELRKIKKKISCIKKIKIYKDINPNKIVQLINEVDFAVVPCSTILFEVLSQQIPVITGFYVDNQKIIASYLQDKFPHILVIGDLNQINIEASHIYMLKNQAHRFGIFELISSNSIFLLKNEFYSLDLEFKIKVRKARIEDVDIYYNWVNDDSVRNNSIANYYITYNNHVNWFYEKLNQDNSLLLIFILDQKPIGQVRFDKEYNNIIIDYSIDKEFRGKNLGKVIMKIAIEKLYNEKIIINSKYLLAKVKESNIASSKVFESLNFDMTSNQNCDNRNYLIYKKVIT